MQLPITLQKNYTQNQNGYQLKLQVKLLTKLADLIAEWKELYDIKIVHGNTVKTNHVKKLRKKLYALKQEENIVFVHGIGKRKSPLQKSIETLE